MSEINPYAAPTSPVDLQPARTGGPTDGPQPWEIGEVLGEAWTAFKRDWPLLVASLVVGYVIMFGAQLLIASVLGVNLFRPAPADPLVARRMLVSALSMFVSAFVMVGWARIWLASARGEAPNFGLLFSGGNRYLVALGAFVLSYLAMLVGLVALVVGAVVVGLGISMTLFYVADSDLGVVDTLKASWNAMRGSKLKLFGFFLLNWLLNIGGVLACGVGVLVTANVTFVGLAIIYTRVSGRSVAGNEPQPALA